MRDGRGSLGGAGRPPSLAPRGVFGTYPSGAREPGLGPADVVSLKSPWNRPSKTGLEQQVICSMVVNKGGKQIAQKIEELSLGFYLAHQSFGSGKAHGWRISPNFKVPDC
ncbi:hypothetical protein BDP55DRAFT_321835 [Colletotrichum godetiae]|uniref:Uncharacterized protein n=1 Tax=Colletotrichum godetiae TaxID=1209918 RepID=A0AAJ0ABN2_9PEZI|nr:uncharacterized protein BDP55DRAFT_321835 [Colletotrichum godetiae]KAK1660118.1 hypothetical protein BDP55DRAFT_321835 [Colletotrichum godetiae]